MQVFSSRHSFAPGLPFERVFCELYVRQRQALVRYILNKVHCSKTAEDICHDVFTKLWFQRERYKGAVDDYGAFLFRIAHNEAVNYLRRQKQAYKALEMIGKQSKHTLNFTEQVVYQKELEVLFQQAIQGLSVQKRKVYVLGRLEGLKLQSIADLLGLSVCTVKEMMRLANTQVRRYINERMHLDGKERRKSGQRSKRKTTYRKTRLRFFLT